MVKQKPKQSEQDKFEVPTRTPKKPGIFDAVGSNRQHGEHPIREMINFPVTENADSQPADYGKANNDTVVYTTPNISESQIASQDIANNETTGKPRVKSLASPTEKSGKPTASDSAIQLENTGNTNIFSRDSQQQTNGDTTSESLEIQNSGSGKTTNEKLDIKLSNDQFSGGQEIPKNDSLIAEAEKLDIQPASKKKDWAKYNKSRSTEPVFIRADQDLVKEIKHFNVEHGLQMRDFFELSALSFMQGSGNTKKGKLDSNISSDERRLIWKTDTSIINLYLAYNLIFNPSTKWKVNDDKVGVLFNDVDIRIVELGIIQSQGNKMQSDPECRINSFKYYSTEINLFVEQGLAPSSLDMILQITRNRWKQITGREVDLKFLETK